MVQWNLVSFDIEFQIIVKFIFIQSFYLDSYCCFMVQTLDMPRLVDATLVLLREESACQQVESDGEIDEDDTEHDEVLMDAVSDLLPAFAKAMGSYFAPIFAKLFEPLMKFSVS